MEVVGKYINGNYTVTILDDGTKIRQTEEDEFIPSFSENCDCKITDKCTQNCPFCYEGCTKEGMHGDLFKYEFLKSLHPYTELALNGNDMDHPQLEGFLMFLKAKRVLANITLNQNQFIKNYERLRKFQERGLVRGIGVSLVSASEELCEKVRALKNVVIHTIVGILSEKDIELLKDRGLKILMLGYKDLQRGVSYKVKNENEIEKNTKWLYYSLREVMRMFEVVSFDNLAITQLDVKRIIPEGKWEEFYMGDDGKYTFYIDMVKGEYAKNSLAQTRFPIGDLSIDEMFTHVKTLD